MVEARKLKQLQDMQDKLVEGARTDLLRFTRYTKSNYEINWHHELTNLYLMKFIRGDIRRLILIEPPRHGKSEQTSRRLPAFIFGVNPNAEIIAASYAATLAGRMSTDVQKIMCSRAYYELFPDTLISDSPFKPAGAGKWTCTKEMFEIIGHKGSYVSAGVGGPITGMGGNFALIDDPIKNDKEAYSQVYRDGAWDWFRSTLYTRLEKDDHILLTLTRWHDDDMAGRMLRDMENDPEADKWVVLHLPAVITQENIEDKHPLDPRGVGEALWPEKYDADRLTRIKAVVGPRWWAALYQGSPVIDGGNLFKTHNFRYFEIDLKHKRYICHRKDKDPIYVNMTDLRKVVYIDPALEEKTQNDPTGWAAWGYSRTHKIWLLLDAHTERIPHTEALYQTKMFAFKNRINDVGAENEKLGKVMVKQSVENDKIGEFRIAFREVPTGGLDKYARAVPMANYQEQERVFYPTNHPCLAEMTNQLVKFPNADHDEYVDVTSMAAELDTALTVAEALAGGVY